MDQRSALIGKVTLMLCLYGDQKGRSTMSVFYQNLLVTTKSKWLFRLIVPISTIARVRN